MKKVYSALLMFIFMALLLAGEELAGSEVTDASFEDSASIKLERSENYASYWSLAGLLEANMKTPKGYAVGSGLYTAFALPDFVKTGRFLIGLKALYSYNPDNYHVFNTNLLFRWTYDFSKTQPDSGIFLQIDSGVALGWNGVNPASKPFTFFLAELSFGYRYTYKNFFIEPYIYGGYPSKWGIGIAIGGGGGIKARSKKSQAPEPIQKEEKEEGIEEMPMSIKR